MPRRGVRYRYRLMAAMLLVSVPLMVALGWLLTVQASSSLTASAQDTGSNIARGVALHMEDWLSERREQLGVIAAEASGQPSGSSVTRLLATVQKSAQDYQLIEVIDLSGRVVSSSRPGLRFAAAGEGWFGKASSGRSVVTSLVRQGDSILWIMAIPIVGPDGRPVGVVAANLNVAGLPALLDPDVDNGSEVVAVDSTDALLYTTSMGRVESAAALLAAGALHSTISNRALSQADATGQPGVARYTDQQGGDTIAGFDRVDDLGWVILVERPASAVLAPVQAERNRAILMVTIGTLLAVLAALIFGGREARKLRGIADETSSSGVEVNSAAAELSASSAELAAITTQQSAAVIQATATTEELARASVAIADTVDEVATQTAETKDNLEQAEADMELSSERTLALARKVNDIDALLDLINDLADQTNLLALNAAIEAARAGENGLGFAVVADEVRRLAERSKASAGEIDTIIRGVQGETTATVLAMEKGAKQMQRGLLLLDAVTDANAQVRLTTQQQRGASAQVAEVMEQLTESSRQVAAAADQIASAAGDLSDLAGNLEETATKAKARY